MLNKIKIKQNFYYLKLQMTKKQRIFTVITVMISLTLITVGVRAYNTAPSTDNKTVGQIIDEMNSLRDLKQECSDNLNIEDSAKFLQSMPWYCDSWDKEIEALRKQANTMQVKWYEKALGLAKDR